jgi:hypothetical protein
MIRDFQLKREEKETRDIQGNEVSLTIHSKRFKCYDDPRYRMYNAHFETELIVESTLEAGDQLFRGYSIDVKSHNCDPPMFWEDWKRQMSESAIDNLFGNIKRQASGSHIPGREQIAKQFLEKNNDNPLYNK